MVHKVVFLPSGKEADARDGQILSDVARAAGVRTPLPCGGAGRCGRCKVSVNGTEVLACKHEVRGDITVTVPVRDRDVVAASDRRPLELDDLTPVSDGLALAVDIGTTTIALSILDPGSGTELYSATDVNGQRAVGDDVLSRIQYASEGGTDDMRGMVLRSINALVSNAPFNGVIESVYIAGNTTMEHLFLGIDPTLIREPPYMPVVERKEVTGKQSGLDVADDARVLTMPCVAAYVGGDITADIVYAGMDRAEGMCLLIDVGTNGEVALGNRDLMVVCSSSAGPAFEGGNLKSGMIARKGAIDSIRIVKDTVRYTVIGGGEPEGICGSGIVDLIAALFSSGAVDRRGNLRPGPNVKDGRFIVCGDIGISDAEIKDVIMTKAAIYSAARTLVRSMGLEFSDLDKVYIAGGFGNYIDMRSAIIMGMFPDVDESKYVYLGNSSLGGAKYALLSQTFRDRIEEVFPRMTYIDLGSDPVFYDEYTAAQFLPNTDASQFPSVRY